MAPTTTVKKSSFLARCWNKFLVSAGIRALLVNNFNRGYAAFEKDGFTSDEAGVALDWLYRETNGVFTEQKQKEISASLPPKKVTPPLDGVVGTFAEDAFAAVDKTLKTDGYSFFEKKLSDDVVARLRDFSLTTEATLSPTYTTKMKYDAKHPQSVKYNFEMNDLINNPDIQALIMDPVLLNIARNYLGSEPIFDFPAMWWSTNFSKEPSHEAAQLYHFDLDRIKWLKIFVYLNDVGTDNGPHCYVRGSHIPGTKPVELLKRGRNRILDGDIQQYYPQEDMREATGTAGTIFAGDTVCWHKGKHLVKGDRLVLEWEYTSSLFGANYPKLVVRDAIPAFKKFCHEQPIFASNITFLN